MFFLLSAIAFCKTYCYYEAAICSSRVDQSFNNAVDILNMIKLDSTQSTILVSGTPPAINISDLAGYDVIFAQDSKKGKIKINFQNKVDIVHSKPIKYVKFVNIPIIPVADPSADSIILNGYAIMFEGITQLEYNKDIGSNIYIWEASITLFQSMKNISNYHHLLISVEDSDSFGKPLPPLNPLPYSEIVVSSDSREPLEFATFGKSFSFGKNGSYYDIQFKETGNLTISCGRKCSLTGVSMDKDVYLNLDSQRGEITIKSGNYNFDTITSFKGSLFIEQDYLKVPTLILDDTEFYNLNSELISIVADHSIFREDMLLMNGSVTIEAETIDIHGYDSTQTIMNITNIKVNSKLSIMNPNVRKNAKILVSQLELGSNCVVSMDFSPEESSLLIVNSVVASRLNYQLMIRKNLKIVNNGTKIPYIQSPSLTMKEIRYNIHYGEKVEGYFYFKEDQNVLATYFENNNTGIELTQMISSENAYIKYKCGVNSIDSLSYDEWKQYDNSFTQTLEFYFCVAPNSSDYLIFKDLKHKMKVSLTHNLPPGNFTVYIDFSEESISKIKSLEVDCNIGPMNSSHGEKTKLNLDSLILRKNIPIDSFDLSGIKNLVASVDFLSDNYEAIKMIPSGSGYFFKSIDIDLTFSNDGIQLSNSTSKVMKIVPFKEGWLFDFSGNNKKLKLIKDPSLARNPKAMITSSFLDVYFEGDWGNLKPYLIDNQSGPAKNNLIIQGSVLPILFMNRGISRNNLKIISLSADPVDLLIDQTLKYDGSMSLSFSNNIRSFSIQRIETKATKVSCKTPNKLMINDVVVNEGSLKISNANANNVEAKMSEITTDGFGSINEINVELPYDTKPSKIYLDLYYSVNRVKIRIPNTESKFKDFDQSFLEKNQSVLCSSFISCDSLMRNVSILPIESLMKDKRVHGVLSCENTISNSRSSRCVIVHRVFEDRNDDLSGVSLTGGAIAGIVIAVLIVVGAAVCVPVAFYFLKKKKSQIDTSP